MKWIDSIMFNGEPVIKLRLEYLFNSIDTFYICEQRYTHQGNRKNELFVEKYLEWFTPYLSKIIFLIDEENNEGSSWDKENKHRNYSIPYILENNKNDKYIISVCDCDEIPDLSKVNKMDIYNKCDNGALFMKQKLFYYNLNWYIGMWSRAFFLNDIILNQYNSFQLWRDEKGPSVGSIECGWHLSYFMNKEGILQKLESFAHSEFNSSNYKDINNIYDCIQQGKLLFKNMNECVNIKKYIEKDFPQEFFSFNDYIINLQK